MDIEIRSYATAYEVGSSSDLKCDQIPHSWKTNIKNENTNTPNPHTILRQLMNTKHTNKYVYNLLQKKRKHPDKKSETKWAEQFHDENLNWNTIYTSSLWATKDIKLQNFNYKFLMRIILPNRFLLKCNIGHTTLYIKLQNFNYKF